MRAEHLFRLQYSGLQKTPFGGQFDVDQENPIPNFNTNLPKSKLKIEEHYPKQTLLFHNTSRRRDDRETTLNLSHQDYILKASFFLYQDDLL